MKLEELVWSVKGFVLLKDELFDFSDIGGFVEQNEYFLDKLEERQGIEERQVWFQKYRPEVFWNTEKEALTDCYDYSENEEERKLMDKRLKELKKS